MGAFTPRRRGRHAPGPDGVVEEHYRRGADSVPRFRRGEPRRGHRLLDCMELQYYATKGRDRSGNLEVIDFEFVDRDDAVEAGGNVEHIAQHGVTPEDVEDVLSSPATTFTTSRTMFDARRPSALPPVGDSYSWCSCSTTTAGSGFSGRSPRTRSTNDTLRSRRHAGQETRRPDPGAGARRSKPSGPATGRPRRVPRSGVSATSKTPPRRPSPRRPI